MRFECISFINDKSVSQKEIFKNQFSDFASLVLDIGITFFPRFLLKATFEMNLHNKIDFY